LQKENGHVVEDPRYAQCTKEMLIVVGFFVLNVLVVMGLAMGIGLNKPAEEINIIMGFPAWFFWGGIVGSIIMIVLTYLMVKMFFIEMPLEEEE
jgi:uncharacterized membrane protein YhdT